MTAADSVAIAVNTSAMKVLQDFTDDRDRLSQVVRNLPLDAGQVAGAGVSGSLQHLTALETAIRILGPVPGNKALVYFNSGRNRHGFAGSPQAKAAVDAAVRANVAFYPVDVSGQGDWPLMQTEISELVVRASAQAPYPYRLVIAAKPVQQVEPAYPAEALAAAFEGEVLLGVIVGADGHVRDVKLLRGPSCADKNCGAEAMVAAAREAVNRNVYEPVKGPDGEPAEIDTVVHVPFRLRSIVTGRAPVNTMREELLMAFQTRRAALSNGDHPARVLSKVDPEYPYALRAQGHQGMVTVEVTVGVDGVPKGVRVTQSDPVFDAAVIAAVRQWRFTPARQNGQEVESTVTLPVSFRLE
jgi:protein TonB